MIRRALGVVLSACVLVQPPVASSAPPGPLPGGVVTTTFYAYVPGDDDLGDGPVTVIVGNHLIYANADLLSHTVTAVAERGEPPAFDSGILRPGEFGVVEGTEQLPPGDHPFSCTLHPFLMRGTLRVLG